MGSRSTAPQGQANRGGQASVSVMLRKMATAPVWCRVHSTADHTLMPTGWKKRSSKA